MDKQIFEQDLHVLEFVFKPIEPGLDLHPEETQLLHDCIDEILGEIEIEEKRIVEEERKAALEVTGHNSKQENKTCK